MADKAVLFGINSYKSISHLRGCINDVKNVADVLTTACGFLSANVRERIDDKATKKEIRKQWKWLLDDAKPGDRLVFHFSGHGSYTTDEDGDEDDGVDELLCLYDMDWNDRETYLLDDDIRQMTEEIPPEVHVTFLFDSCHSGTATKALRLPGLPDDDESMRPMIDVGSTVGRSSDEHKSIERAIAPSTAIDARRTVLARFVPPPSNVIRKLRRNGIRRQLIEMRDSSAMNHVLFSGSRSDQTSADAFIDGDYNGAFSYYFCEAIRLAVGVIDHQEVINKVRRQLEDEHFSQIPQLEPEGTTGPIFKRTLLEMTTGPVQDNNATIKLLERIVTLLEGRDGDLSVVGRSNGSPHLVYVHGICRHEAGYSKGWWQALKPHLSSALQNQLETNRHEILWSDLVSPSGTRAIGAGVSPDEQRLADSIRDVLEDRAEREALISVAEQRAVDRPIASRIVVDRAALGIPGLNCVDDFAKYLLSDSIRDQVIGRFLQVVEPLLRSGSSVIVISHSWGTVVAYEGLRLLDAANFSGRVSDFFTVGSALSIAPVRRGLRQRDGARPSCVREWINLDTRGDVVGGALQTHFAVDSEFLELSPVGCQSFLGVVSPSCAHGSYFSAENLAVNSGIFANRIEH